jgi:hypothetical protein
MMLLDDEFVDADAPKIDDSLGGRCIRLVDEGRARAVL